MSKMRENNPNKEGAAPGGQRDSPSQGGIQRLPRPRPNGTPCPLPLTLTLNPKAEPNPNPNPNLTLTLP